MVDHCEQETGENRPVPKLVLIVVFPVREQHRQPHQYRTINHQPAAEAWQYQHNQIVFGYQSQQVPQNESEVDEEGQLAVEVSRHRRPAV